MCNEKILVKVRYTPSLKLQCATNKFPARLFFGSPCLSWFHNTRARAFAFVLLQSPFALDRAVGTKERHGWCLTAQLGFETIENCAFFVCTVLSSKFNKSCKCCIAWIVL